MSSALAEKVASAIPSGIIAVAMMRLVRILVILLPLSIWIRLATDRRRNEHRRECNRDSLRNSLGNAGLVVIGGRSHFPKRIETKQSALDAVLAVEGSTGDLE